VRVRGVGEGGREMRGVREWRRVKGVKESGGSEGE
jgi:hypothetical protein